MNDISEKSNINMFNTRVSEMVDTISVLRKERRNSEFAFLFAYTWLLIMGIPITVVGMTYDSDWLYGIGMCIMLTAIGFLWVGNIMRWTLNKYG